MNNQSNAAVDRREFVIGLVGPTGSGMPLVVHELRSQMSRFGYVVELIKVSESFRSLSGDWASLPRRPERPADERYKAFMEAGDKLRRQLGRMDAAMLPALRLLRERRKRRSGSYSTPADAVLYVIDSLKTPEELNLLRRIYGGRFVAIAAHSPRDVRRWTVAKEIATSRHGHKGEKYMDRAESILYRDERGTEEDLFGQNVADTFPLVDCVLPSISPESVRTHLVRFINVLFGRQFITPNRDEYGMFVAHASSLLSAATGRQVGAALLSSEGTVLATGTNEVPKYGGGHYWEGDEPDGRDFQRGNDTSDKMRRNLLGNTLDLLIQAGWTPPQRGSSQSEIRRTQEQRRKSVQRELDRLSKEPRLAQLRNSLLIQDVIEFYREVHAEMAALMDAVRSGIKVRSSTLYATTFPCHECARHVVSAGLERVVFLQPYPKSLVTESYNDSIVLDPQSNAEGFVTFETFIGITPRRYLTSFRMGRRKSDGEIPAFDEASAGPLLESTDPPHPIDSIEHTIRNTEMYSSIQREEVAYQTLKVCFDGAMVKKEKQ